ncbi:MAG: hypothetical protein CL609_07490 [Anaerolineaceae bacterium]|nr:hypothetical protein [Anaerolineaceae bacterium]
MLAMDEDELSQLLGLRINAIQSDIGLSLQPSIEVELSPFEAVRLPTWVQKTVDAMIKTALEQSRNVLCSEEPDFDNIRNQLIAAMGLGGTALVLAFAAFLTSTLGIAAALATVLATIVIKKIGEPTIKAGHHTMCVELNKILEAKYSTSNN